MTVPPVYPLTPRQLWQEYLTREHTARDGYLAVIAEAGQEYLTGPYADHDSYQTVERQAWYTYYQAGRAAWIWYTAAMTNPNPMPAQPVTDRIPETVTGTGWPASPYDYPQPAFTPATENHR